MGYLRQTVTGTTWMGGFRISSRVIAFAKMAIVARILTPAQFGVYSIATLVLAFLEVFTETGVNTVLIQKKKQVNDYFPTAWVVSIIRGFTMAVVIISIANPVALFFDSPESVKLLILISLVPLIRGFINPSVVLFQKNLEFRKEFWYKFIVFASDAFFAVIITLVSQNAIGLIWGFVIGAVIEVALSFIMARPFPQLAYDRTKLKEILLKGKWVTSSRIFSYIFAQGDDILVGRLLGTGLLGIYQAAYRLSTLPVSEVADVVGKVTFPVYVKISHDQDRLRKAFIKSAGISLGVSSVMGTFIFLFSHEIVLLMLGNAWFEVEPILRILVWFGIIKAVTTSFHSLFLALGNQKLVSNLLFTTTIALGCLIVPLTHVYGLVGVSLAVVWSSLLGLVLSVFYARKWLLRINL